MGWNDERLCSSPPPHVVLLAHAARVVLLRAAGFLAASLVGRGSPASGFGKKCEAKSGGDISNEAARMMGLMDRARICRESRRDRRYEIEEPLK